MFHELCEGNQYITKQLKSPEQYKREIAYKIRLENDD